MHYSFSVSQVVDVRSSRSLNSCNFLNVRKTLHSTSAFGTQKRQIRCKKILLILKIHSLNQKHEGEKNIQNSFLTVTNLFNLTDWLSCCNDIVNLKQMLPSFSIFFPSTDRIEYFAFFTIFPFLETFKGRGHRTVTGLIS